MESKIGLIIQLTGVILLTILTMSLRRSLKVTALKYWTYAWLSLSFALVSLRIAFSYEQPVSSLYGLYFFGEYTFGVMLVAGCRSLLGDRELKMRSALLIPPFGIIAIGLAASAKEFNEVYSFHSVILSGFFAAAFFALGKSQVRTFGARLMHIALALLALDYFLFFAIFWVGGFFAFPFTFLKFNSVVDLILETALGFGMVIVLLERLIADSKTANEKLEDAQKRLEELAHTDPLTEAFNRHAFYGFVNNRGGKSESVSGCVGFFDIDDLKGINDRFGHAAGDQAIRTVARTIREVIRAEDLIYRWGGDEFFVLMVSMEAEMAEIRMQRLEDLMTGIKLDDIAEAIDIRVSCGFTDFDDSTKLEKAVKEADSEMYRRKQMRKQAAKGSIGYMHTVGESHNAVRI